MHSAYVQVASYATGGVVVRYVPPAYSSHIAVNVTSP